MRKLKAALQCSNTNNHIQKKETTFWYIKNQNKKGPTPKQETMMPTLFLPLTILTLSFLSFTQGNHVPPCSDAFLKLCQQKNMTECKKLRTLGAEFGWSYNNVTNNTIITLDILFGATLDKAQGWIAWGVNPGKRPEMVGTKAIIGVKSSEGKLLGVKTYNVTERTRNGCSLSPSDIGIAVSNMEMAKLVGDVYTIHARLFLPNGHYNVSRLNHVWQVGDSVEGDIPLRHPTTLHNVDSTEVIDLTSSTGLSTGQYRSYLRSVHGVLNIIGWGTLLPIGIIIARYFRVFPFRCEPTWFTLHVGCQLTGFLVGTAGWAIGLSLGHSSRYYTFHAHRTYGILIFTLSTIQMLAFRLKPKVTDDYRKYWNMYHHFLGYGLLAIIIINIFKGICILEGGKAWKWGYIANLAFLGAIAFALEVYTWIRFCMDKRAEKTARETGEQLKHKT